MVCKSIGILYAILLLWLSIDLSRANNVNSNPFYPVKKQAKRNLGCTIKVVDKGSKLECHFEPYCATLFVHTKVLSYHTIIKLTPLINVRRSDSAVATWAMCNFWGLISCKFLEQAIIVLQKLNKYHPLFIHAQSFEPLSGLYLVHR